MTKENYIEAFESVYDFDKIDMADYEHEYLLYKIEEHIEDCEFDERIPSEQEMADIVEQALTFIQYGDTSDVDDMIAIYEDYYNRFPDGR